MKPIYEPKGRAKEYGDYAINIYTGCPHRCYYCFAPNVLKKAKDEFHGCIEPRDGIVEAVRKQLYREQITDKTIHLCFTCDPYPTGYDTIPTREIIKAIKDSGNHVQILTKGDGSRDFDLLDENDWYGISISCISNHLYEAAEPMAVSPIARIRALYKAKSEYHIKTWASFEPVISTADVMCFIESYAAHFDKIKIGKLNYWKSDIDWKKFGHEVEDLCKRLGVDYYIKDSLRAEMTEVRHEP